jgi:2-desacetyl-2-hydroxyethyl bacteriochlorophyllide A dehydrogenase
MTVPPQFKKFNKMKALQIVEPGNIRLCHIDSPEIKPGEILVKIHYAGFCGSDLNTYTGKNPMVKLPVIPGHEIGGEIAEITEGVPAGFEPGTACTVNPYTSCGHCAACRNGRPNACRYNRTFGVQRDGAMCEYIAVPWQKVIADRGLTPRQFALVEPMSVGFHAVERAAITDLDSVMVIGCGMIGFGAVIRSVLRGATVIAVDTDDGKLALARRLGAAEVINSKTQDVHRRLEDITGGNGPDAIIEAVGAPATYQMAVNEVAFTGRVACIGYAKTEIAFETKYFVMKEMDIRGSRNALPEDFRAVIACLKRGTCPEQEFISAVYPPEQAKEALDKWTADPGKVFRILIAM